MTTNLPYWFADVDDEGGNPPYVWRPYLETRTGHVPGIEVWFDSRQRCEDWIRDFVVGAPLNDDEPCMTAPEPRVVGLHSYDECSGRCTSHSRDAR